MEIWIHAPRGFRPSNWVDMLRDFDVAWDLDPYLVDPRYVKIGDESHHVLALLTTLLEEHKTEKKARESLFKEMMSRAAEIGLHVSVPAEFADRFPHWWIWIQEYCAKESIPLDTR